LVKPEKPKLEDTEFLGEEDMEEMEEEEDPQQILEQIREIEMFMEGGIQNIPDDYIVGLLRSYLAKNFCQNRGYVLDDYPRITEQVDGLEKNEKPVFTYSFRLKNCLVKAKMREEKKKKQQKFRTEIKFYRISWSAWWQRMNSSPNES
jgi:adenylate kinase family enzyme